MPTSNSRKTPKKSTTKRVTPRAKKAKQSGSLTKTLRNNPIVFIIVLVLAFVGVALLFRSLNSSPDQTTSTVTNTNVKATAKIYLNPSSGALQTNTSTTIELREDSKDTSINAVNAEIAYDISKFKVTSIDAGESPFEFKFVEDSNNGLIRIARGTTTPVSGDKLIAKIVLTPIEATDKTSLTFSSETAIASANEAQNVLKTAKDATFSIK